MISLLALERSFFVPSKQSFFVATAFIFILLSSLNYVFIDIISISQEGAFLIYQPLESLIADRTKCAIMCIDFSAKKVA